MTKVESSNLRRFLPLLALPAVAGPLFVLVFIFRTETAHDEQRCPYRQLALRKLASDVVIVEQGRSCLPNVEERRYVLHRGDHEQVLGRRRFEPGAFAAPDYGWDAGVRESGEVHMHVVNPGHGNAEFREGRPDER